MGGSREDPACGEGEGFFLFGPLFLSPSASGHVPTWYGPSSGTLAGCGAGVSVGGRMRNRMGSGSSAPCVRVQWRAFVRRTRSCAVVRGSVGSRFALCSSGSDRYIFLLLLLGRYVSRTSKDPLGKSGPAVCGEKHAPDREPVRAQALG